MTSRIAVACALALSSAAVFAQAVPAVYRVQVAADGSFSPATLRIRPGDTVEWSLPGRSSAIVTAAGEPAAGMCPVSRAWSKDDPQDFTGPESFAPSGIFSLGPLEDRGLHVQSTPCPGGRAMPSVNGQYICATGPAFTTMEETWADGSNVGVFIRLLWNRVQPRSGTDDSSFDWSDLDREIDQAVRHGKLYSLAIKAGVDGTPDWIFTGATQSSANAAAARAGGRGRGAARAGGAAGATTTPNATPATGGGGGGVVPLVLQDSGSGTENRGGQGCGVRMTLGSPTDPKFEQYYFEMLTKVAAHIRARADRFRALAYIKPSGANLFSHENRLPKRCEPGCICNPQVFAEHGYTPTKLYGFYRRQFALLAREFPGKAISYALIQDGFPSVNDSGGWEMSNGKSSNAKPLPAGAEQTEEILAIGQKEFGSRFVVQHNGLQVYKPGCANEGKHPAKPPYTLRGAGCPNHWVLKAGADGDTITGFQTQNLGDINTPEDVDLAMKNILVNSDGVFIELYEGPLWLAARTNKGVLPSRKTLAQLAEDLHERRRKMYGSLGDPFPTVYRHTFKGTAPGTMYYFDPSACRAGKSAPVGTITIER